MFLEIINRSCATYNTKKIIRIVRIESDKSKLNINQNNKIKQN